MKFFKEHIMILLLSLSLFSKDNNVNTSIINNYRLSKIDLIESNISNTLLDINVEGFSLEEILIDNQTKYTVIINKGTSILNEGYPDLPKLNTSIIIPDNSNMKIEVLSLEYEEVKNVEIAPSKGNLSRNIDPLSIPYNYGNIYHENKYYPENIAELGDPYILRNMRGQSVIIYPIQYNAVEKTLRIYKNIKLKITEETNKGLQRNVYQRRALSDKPSKEYNRIYENLFINYSSANTRFDYLDEQGDMLIICYDDFIEEMEPFVDWKNKKGIQTEIVGVNSIGSTVNAIQTYINNYYYENNLTYLLLVGDVAQIPTPYINGSAADPSYGFIDGDDSFAEVIVGRFSANNPNELITQIERSIDYERNPSYVNHFNKALGIGSNQGPGYEELTDAEFNNLLWDDHLSTFTYASYEGIFDPDGTVQDGINAINNGVGIINYTGHAGTNGWGNGAPLDVNDVYQLNNVTKLPFIFTVGCNPGEFDIEGECFCESWMRAKDSEGNAIGAVAHLGSTISQSWEPPMHGQWAMNAILTETFDENLTRTFGGIAVNGCMHMNEAQGSYGVNETNHWTIFGDPSLVIRTEEPYNLNAIFNETIILGQPELVIDVGIDGVIGAISSDGNLLTAAVSNGGEIILDISEVSLNPGDLDLVITSFNTYPIETNLNVITQDGPYLVYNNYDLISDSNFNDNIEFGEEIELNLNIQNVGEYNASAINVEVTSNDPYISINNGNTMIAYAIAGENATTEAPISFSILNSVPDGHLAQFQTVLTGEEEWQFSFSVEIHSPVFEILNPTIVDENNDGVWDPGETAIISVDLYNSGSAAFSYYPGATISTDNENIEILSGENHNTFFGIGPYTTYEGVFEVEADVLTPLNMEVNFNISWGYSSTAPCDHDCVEQAEITYSTIIGHPSILIWDASSNHISGSRIIEHFNSINFSSYNYYTNYDDIENIENYTSAFIFLGVYSNNHILEENEAQLFADLLNNGGNLYMEGGDTWSFNQQTVLHSMFGISAGADGTDDLELITGIDGTFTEGLSFSYNGGNSYVDRIIPNGGFPILENTGNSNYITAVAYDNLEIGYRTIGTSHDIGGLQGDDFTAYIDGILNFFENGSNGGIDPLCMPGDLSEDGSVDITDVVRLVNIIINFGVPPTEYELCASDVNIDGDVNVLDVVTMINLILGIENNRSMIRTNPINEIDLLIEENSLIMINQGIIKAIELEFISDSYDFEFKDKYMEYAYNRIENKHYLLIYSLNGNYFESGENKIFSLSEEFEIKNIIAVNTNNESVDIHFNKSNPESFVLKQNYPNPFNPTTNIDVELGHADFVQLVIYDINGRLVKELTNGFYQKGNHSFIWDAKDNFGNEVSSGMYIYTMISENHISSNKMLFIK